MGKYTEEIKAVCNEAMGLAMQYCGIDALSAMAGDENAAKAVSLYGRLMKASFEYAEICEAQLDKISELGKQNEALERELREIHIALSHLDTKLDGLGEALESKDSELPAKITKTK